MEHASPDEVTPGQIEALAQAAGVFIHPDDLLPAAARFGALMRALKTLQGVDLPEEPMVFPPLPEPAP